jgi:hypothetical protein
LKVNNEEKDYGPRNSKLSKSYFCGSINNTESPFAVFDSVEDSLNFIAEYLKAKVDSKLLSGADIKNSQGKINDIDNLAKAMDNFLFTSYPLEDTNINYETTIFPTQQCKDRISQIKSAIQQAEILGL